MKIKLLSTLLALSALTAACGDDDSTGPDEGDARVRVVHASPDAPSVDVTSVVIAVVFSSMPKVMPILAIMPTWIGTTRCVPSTSIRRISRARI